MFARKVVARVKPDSLSQFKNLIECEVLPWLRQQQGFLYLLILAARDCGEVATISFWDHEADAGRSDLSGTREVLNSLGALLDGHSYVRTFDVISSTFQDAMAAPSGDNVGGNDFLSLTQIS
jgi:hypothetical protein